MVKRMFAAFREYTLDLWDLLVGNQYPRTVQLTALTEASKQQQNNLKLNLEHSLSPPPLAHQPSLVAFSEDVPSGSASVCITAHQQEHEEF